MKTFFSVYQVGLARKMSSHSMGMRNIFFVCFLFFSAVAFSGLVFPAPAMGQVIYSAQGYAIRGYDPVAYFTRGQAVKGKSDHQSRYEGAVWLFSTAKNKAVFDANPKKYAPQYGGYCAWAVGQGYTASIDPRAWKIVDHKLYLNYSKSVQDTWSRNTRMNISNGDANWPRIRAALAEK